MADIWDWNQNGQVMCRCPNCQANAVYWKTQLSDPLPLGVVPALCVQCETPLTEENILVYDGVAQS